MVFQIIAFKCFGGSDGAGHGFTFLKDLSVLIRIIKIKSTIRNVVKRCVDVFLEGPRVIDPVFYNI